MHTVEVDTFGRAFRVVEPISIGLPQHTTGEFFDHEPTLERWCRGIKTGDVVVDAGAHFGPYTMTALSRGAFVVAYEPTDDGAKILSANVEANGWTSRCVIQRACLFNGDSYPQALADSVFGHHYPTARDFPTVRLDDDLRAIGVGRVDWMKIDVEGVELGVLQGASQTLEACRPTLIIEDHQSINTEVDANGKRICEVSHYPETIDSRRRIHEMLGALGYAIEVVPWDVSRHYIVAQHPSRTRA